MKLSEKIKNVSPSPTLAITQKAAEMKREGIDVVSFGAGEPDFDTPVNIKNACKKALDEGFTKYTAVAGIPELRAAIATKISSATGVGYAPEETISTCGAKQAIFAAMQVLLNAGDEVVIPAPYWVSYPDQVKLADAKPVIVQTLEENNFKITPAELEKAISSKTKMLILNSPSNPTGAIYSKSELHDLVDICVKKDIAIIADEIYDKLVYDGGFTSVLSSHPRAKDVTIYVNGVAKSHAMTGWRVGYAAGPKDVISAMTKYQGQLLTNITSFVQKATIEALNTPEETIAGMITTFKKRRDLIVELIGNIPHLKCIRPAGAFYTFINTKHYEGDSQKLSTALLENAHVAVVPGVAFGTEGYIRLSFATSEENIRKGLDRIKKFLEQL